MAQSRKEAAPRPCPLLDPGENEILHSLIDRNCSIKASGVVLILIWNNDVWCKRAAGVATFVRDKNRRSYFIQVFDIEKKGMILEQELYFKFIYDRLHKSLIGYDAQPESKCLEFEFDSKHQNFKDYYTGLLFANDNEASSFSAAIDDCLRTREERRRQSAMKSTNAVKPMTPPSASTVRPNNITNVDQLAGNKGTLRKKVITRDDIGNPQDFRHIAHIDGTSNSRCFTNIDQMPELRELFRLAGLENEILKMTNGEVTSIMDEMAKHYASPEEMIADLRATTTAGATVSAVPSLPPRPAPVPALVPAVHVPAPAPVPVRPPEISPATRPLPATPRPPLPTAGPMPSRPLPVPPQTRPTYSAQTTTVAPGPTLGVGMPTRMPSRLTPPAPPPPPPPPPPPAPPAPPAPPVPPTAPMPPPLAPPAPAPAPPPPPVLSIPSAGAATLHAPKPPAQSAPSGRDALLNAIRQGAALKPVDQTERPPVVPADSSKQPASLVDLLSKVMQSRRPNIASDEEGNSDKDDSEWDQSD